MSGTAWRERAKRIVDSASWPENISTVDREAVENFARGPGFEPYYTLKGVIEGIDGGFYKRSRFSENGGA